MRCGAIAEFLEPRRLLTDDPSGLSISVNGTDVANNPATTIDLTNALANGGSVKIIVSNVTASPINFSEADALPGLTVSPAIASSGAFGSTLSTFTIAGGASQTFTLKAGSTPGSFLDPVRFQNDLFQFYEFALAASVSSAQQTPPINSSGQVTVADQVDTDGLQFVGNTNGEAYFGLTGASSNVTVSLNNVTDNGNFGSTPKLHLQLIKDANSNGILDSSELSGPSLLDQQVATGGSNNSFVVQGVAAGSYFVFISPTVTTTSGTGDSSAIITYNLGVTAASLTPGAAVTSTANNAAIQNGQSTALSANNTSFGTVQPGASPIIEQYAVTNSGTGVLDLSNLQVSGGAFDVESNLPATLAPQATANFSIGLLSSGSGVQNGTVSFTDNVSAQSPFTFAVSGAVAAAGTPEPSVAILDATQAITNGQASAIDFGSIAVGAAPASQTFTVQNNGTASLIAGAIGVPAGFTVASGLSGPIPAGSSAAFTVQLNSASAGNPSGLLSFTTNDPNAPHFSFPISGTVTSASTPPPPAQGLGVNQVTTQKIPASLVGGQKTSTGQILVILKNLTAATLSGFSTVNLFASPSSSSVAAGSLPLGHANAKLKLKVGQSQVVKIKVVFPSVSADESLFIVAQASGAGVTSGGTLIGAAANPVNVLKPFVSLQGPGAGATLSATPGKPLTFSILLKNLGDVTAAGSVNLASFLSTDGTLATATPLPTVVTKISIKPNAGKLLKVKFTLPKAASAGSFTLLVKLKSTGSLATLNLLDGQIIATFPINVA